MTMQFTYLNKLLLFDWIYCNYCGDKIKMITPPITNKKPVCYMCASKLIKHLSGFAMYDGIIYCKFEANK